MPPASDGAGEDDAGPCPVTINGSQSGRYSFLTPSGEDRSIAADGFSAGNLIDLFQGRVDWLWKKFPVRDKDGNVKSWNAKAANEWLVREAARLPLFNYQTQMRGPGAWLEEGDEETPDHVVVHHGDGIFVNLPEDQGGGTRKPSIYRGVIYPLRPPEAKPADKPVSKEEMNRLLSLVKTWCWKRPEIDPVLLLGWIALCMVCGALDWRPSMWIAGDRATGKSTLQGLIHRIVGKIMIQAAEPTEAFLRQALRGAARPVELDEFEAEEQTWKRQQVFNLIRIGSTRGGPGIGRGSAEGNAVMYNIDAIFLCSSILRPTMKPADLQRFTVLELLPLEANLSSTLKITAEIRRYSKAGTRMQRRMLERWDDFRTTMQIYKEALAGIGHGSRSSDQYAPILAAADIMLNDNLIEPSAAAGMVASLDPITIADSVGDESDSRACLNYLLSSVHPEWSGNRRPTIGALMRQAGSGNSKHAEDACTILEGIGMKVGMLHLDPSKADERPRELCVAVSLAHRQLAEIYKGTHWGTSSGRAGGWVQSFRRLSDAAQESRTVRMLGVATKCVIFPFFNLDIDTADQPDEVVTASGGDNLPEGHPAGAPVYDDKDFKG